jgi:5-methyltetrahydropteroyltriglutamate--homocysteine methyltransferase
VAGSAPFNGAMSILTTVVGSYPVPAWLLAHPTRQALVDATAVVLRTQELAGIDLVADGELSRFDPDHPDTNGMIDYFVRSLGGVRTRLGRSEREAFRADAGMAFRAAPAGVVEGPIDEGTLDLPEAARLPRSLTRAPLKFTLTGPHMLAKTLVDRHHGSREALAAAIADVLAAQAAALDADVVQVDEANLPGHPEEATWALPAVNRVLDAVRGTPAVHLCFGNYGGQTIQTGTWERLVAFLSGLRADHVLVELARRGPGELSFLSDVDGRISFGLGVIDIKTNVVEGPEEVARRIEAAAGILGVERIAYVNPDCGFWMLPRSVADRKMHALVAGRDLFEGR